MLPPHAPFVPMCFVSDATDLCAPQVRLECQIVCVPDVEVLAAALSTRSAELVRPPLPTFDLTARRCG